MGYPGIKNSKIYNRPSGGGNKLQGLAPKATSFFLAPSTGRQYSTETGDGKNRHKEFCINQIGGIGRGRSQFRSNADGTICKDQDSPRVPSNAVKFILSNTIFFINSAFTECSLFNPSREKNYWCYAA